MTGDESVDWAAAYRYLEQQLESVLTRVAERMEQLEARTGEGAGVRIRSVSLAPHEPGQLRSVIAADGADLTYAFTVYRDDVVVREHDAGPSNTLVWRPSASGTYRVRGRARAGGEEATAASRGLPVTVRAGRAG